MPAHLIDGKAIADKRRVALATGIAQWIKPPVLAVIIVGDDPASQVYVRHKISACAKTGMGSREVRLPATADYATVAAAIDALNVDPDIHGILLQLPLPQGLDAAPLIARIDPRKDVDGLTTPNMGRLFAGDTSGLVPCTPLGSLALIRSVQPDISGTIALVIGRSQLFGKPMAQLLLQADCTVIHVHSRSRNIPDLCRMADILVVAIGKPHFVKGDWIKDGAIVIDVGINRRDDGTLCGDVDTDAAMQRAAYITPVPGGVGPMTITCLLENTVKAAQNQGFGS